MLYRSAFSGFPILDPIFSFVFFRTFPNCLVIKCKWKLESTPARAATVPYGSVGAFADAVSLQYIYRYQPTPAHPARTPARGQIRRHGAIANLWAGAISRQSIIPWWGSPPTNESEGRRPLSSSPA